MIRQPRLYALLASLMLLVAPMQLLLRGAAKPVPLPLATQAPAALPLTGIVILVDPGHGGYDGGAVGRAGTIEKNLNLQVSVLVADALRAQGATVVLTREGDYALCGEKGTLLARKREDMARRGDILRANEAVLVLSIHMNRYRDGRASGPQVFYQKGDERSLRLAQTLQASLIEGLEPSWKRQAASGDFYMLRQGPLAVLVECGFVSNAAEEKKLQDPAYQLKIAQAIVAGVVRHRALDDTPWLTEYPREEAVALA